jgi:hypothetical protein
MDESRDKTGIERKVGPGVPPEHSMFKKGQSGNPNGRPKKLPEIEELLGKILSEEKDGKTAAEAILMALRAKAAKGDIRAAEVLLDRAYGKANQYIKEDIHNRIDITWHEPGDIRLPDTKNLGGNGVVQSIPGGVSDNSEPGRDTLGEDIHDSATPDSAGA